MTEKLIPFDPARYLRTPEEIAEYLETVFDEYGHDHRTVVKALGDAARAQGMQKIARTTGLTREGLYKSLSQEGNPSFETVLKVVRALGIKLKPEALPEGKGRTSQPR